MVRLSLCLFCFSLPVLQLLHHVNAFPDNLYGPVGCATELATDEVILNSLITSFANSRDSAVTVVVLAPDGTTELESPVVVSKVPMTVTMVVRNPNSLGGMQYVMDVGSTTAAAAEGTGSGATGTGAYFERGQCDGKKRVTGRPGDRHTLIIEKIPETPIQVWAGWACSHETVTLTNYFIFSKQPEHGGGAAQAVEEAVGQVLDLEQADQKEREDIQAELGDDDAANAGDLEEQLDQMHADKGVRQDMQHLFKNRAHWEEKDPNHRLPHQNLEKYKDLIQEKKVKPLDAAKAVDWAEVKKRLALEGRLDGLKTTKMAEHKRLMLERRERMMKENPNGPIHSNAEQELHDMARRSGMYKERFEERRAMMLQKLKAPLPNDAEEGEATDETNSDPVQRRAREAYEEQDSDIVVKELLIGLLGILLANWLIVQLCLWNDKRHKGRRVL